MTHKQLSRLDDDTLIGEHRTIRLSGQIDEESATAVIAKLLFMQHVDASMPIQMYIDSPGGMLVNGFEIVDWVAEAGMVMTHCLAQASGIALVILAAGKPGDRTAAPGAKLALVNADAENQKLAEVLARCCKRTEEQLLEDLRASRVLDVQTAIAEGFIDRAAE